MALNRDVEAAVCAQVFGKQAATGLHLSMLDGLYSLVRTRPAAFASAVAACSLEALKQGLQDHGVPVGRGSTVPYRVLLTAVESTVAAAETASVGNATLGLSLEKRDHHRMLQALSRSPESQVVSPSLFVALFAEWCRQEQSASIASATAPATGTGTINATTQPPPPARPLLADREVHSQLMLALPDCMFLFDLIRTRLAVPLARIAELSDRLSLRALASMLRDNSIDIKPSRWAAVIEALKLPEYGVFGAADAMAATSAHNDSASACVSGGQNQEIVASALLRICNACVQSNVLVLPDYQVAADVRDRKLYAKTLLREMRNAWPAVESRLQATGKSGNVGVSAVQYFELTASVGLQLSAEDCQLAWALLQQKAQTSVGGSIAAGALDAIFRSDSTLALDTDANAAAHVSMLTALTHRKDALSGPCETDSNGLYHQTQHRRHVPSGSHQAATVLGQYLEWRPVEYAHADLVPRAFANTLTHKYSARLYGNGQRQGLPWELQDGESSGFESNAGGSDALRSGIAPWMQQSRDENFAATNNMKHVMQRLHELPTTTKFSSFVKMLDSAHEAAGKSGLTRHAIANALGAVGIRVDQKQAALLFAGAAAASGERERASVAVTPDSMLAWLDCAVPVGDVGDATLCRKLAAARKVIEHAPVRETRPAVQVNFSATPAAAASAPGGTAQEIAPAEVVFHSELPARRQPQPQPAQLGLVTSPPVATRTAGLARRATDTVYTVISQPAPASPSSSQFDASAYSSPAKGSDDAGKKSSQAAAQNKVRNDTSRIFSAPTFFDNSSDEDDLGEGKGLEEPSFSSMSVTHRDIYPSPGPLIGKFHSNASPAVAVADISAAVVDVLQRKRAALALLFRRLSAAAAGASHPAVADTSGAGLVSLRAFSETIAALVGGALGDRLSCNAEATHKIACDIINAPYTCDANVVTVHFTDVISYLDAVAGEQQRGDMASSILRRLKDKCHVAAGLRGEKLRLLMLTPQLRQRLKQRFLAGKSLGYQGSGTRDQCSAQDLVDVFESIDVHLSPLEAKFLCTATGDEFDGSRTALEAGTSLGAVVRFLSENVLV